MSERWSVERADQWGKSIPWLVGSNYIPRTAINQLEMWQEETFDAKTIEEELGWAASLGMNSMRVFLHDLPWEQDAQAFLGRIDRFLGIARQHGIGALLVFFDSVWHPFPRPGRQREPEPGVHNSGWVQSPGVEMLRDHLKFDRLRDYVMGVVEHFRDDDRVHGWDVWNEPDNANGASYGPRDIRQGKSEVVAPLLERAFAWARSARPTQPLTSGIWSAEPAFKPIEQLQVHLSDVVSFHDYGTPENLERIIARLQHLGRPLLCTEYMARGRGSTFAECLPILKKHGVAAYNWGFVAGRSQTNFPWDSWERQYPPEPPIWFHDIFRGDGTAYDPAEIAAIRAETGKGGGRSAKSKGGARRSQRTQRARRK